MEIITANGTEYQCSNVSTGTNSISFTTQGDAAVLKESFKEVTELTVSGEDKEVYGTYTDLSFESITEMAEGGIVVTIHIATSVEKRLEVLETNQATLEVTQAEQDEAIAELYGGDELEDITEETTEETTEEVSANE